MLWLLLGCWQSWTVTLNEGCDEPATWYGDGDDDGVGSNAYTLVRCSNPDGYVPEGGDCNDADPTVYPGADEACDGSDQDCDGQIDEGGADLFYADGDGDDFGDDDDTQQACSPPAGYVAEGGDCDDQDQTRYPGADEVCDSVDQDCDNQVDEDAIDASTWYVDDDNDSYGGAEVLSCSQPPGTTEVGGDCMDDVFEVNPGADEVCDNGIDDNCDGSADPCAWNGTYEALTQADSWGFASTNNTYHGWALATGDLNGNGQTELLVSMLNTGGPGAVISMEAPFAFSFSLEEQTTRLVGSDGDWAGWAMAVLDADGDGQDDLAVSGFNEDKVYLVRGPVSDGSLLDYPSLDLQGLGYTISSGNTNGDSRDEFCSGAPLLGGNTGAVVIAGDLEDPDVVMGESSDSFGYSCLLMDLNGDGLDGLVGGAPLPGVVAVFEQAPTGIVSRNDADTLIQGGEFFGFSLSQGDLDGDGYADLLVGSPFEDLGGSDSGSVFLFPDPLSANQDQDASAHYDGPTPSDEAGRAIETGDVDVDGTIDLLVSLPSGAGGQGAVHLVFSPQTSGSVDLGGSDAAFEGWGEDGDFGQSLVLEDLDGDTDLDLVMGAPYESSAAGGAWIWLTPGL